MKPPNYYFLYRLLLLHRLMHGEYVQVRCAEAVQSKCRTDIGNQQTDGMVPGQVLLHVSLPRQEFVSATPVFIAIKDVDVKRTDRTKSGEEDPVTSGFAKEEGKGKSAKRVIFFRRAARQEAVQHGLHCCLCRRCGMGAVGCRRFETTDSRRSQCSHTHTMLFVAYLREGRQARQ